MTAPRLFLPSATRPPNQHHTRTHTHTHTHTRAHTNHAYTPQARTLLPGFGSAGLSCTLCFTAHPTGTPSTNRYCRSLPVHSPARSLPVRRCGCSAALPVDVIELREQRSGLRACFPCHMRLDARNTPITLIAGGALSALTIEVATGGCAGARPVRRADGRIYSHVGIPYRCSAPARSGRPCCILPESRRG
jgi:hypothetical protein